MNPAIKIGSDLLEESVGVINMQETADAMNAKKMPIPPSRGIFPEWIFREFTES